MKFILALLFLIVCIGAASAQQEDKVTLQQQLLLSKEKQAEIALKEQEKIKFEKQKEQLAAQEKQLLRLGLTQKESELKEQSARAEAIRLASQYQAAIKDKQILSQDTDIRQTRRWVFYLISISMLILVAAVVTYLNQRRTRQLNKRITEQHEELSQVSSVKDRLLTIVGHDMRGPLNMLLGLSQILSKEDVPQAKMEAYMKQLESTLTHTSSMMDNLLYWAASQMQGYSPVIRDVDISEVVADIVMLQEAKAMQKGISLHKEVPAGLTARCDHDMLTLVIRNLISNAIKFTPTGGTIIISSSEEKDNTVISVSDNGIGLSQVYIDHFNSTALSGIESTRGTDKEKGTGLGLLLCKTFARLMNGRMWASLNPSGSGSVFKIILPNA